MNKDTFPKSRLGTACRICGIASLLCCLGGLLGTPSTILALQEQGWDWWLVQVCLSLWVLAVLTGVAAIVCGRMAQMKTKTAKIGCGVQSGYISIVVAFLMWFAISNLAQARERAMQHSCRRNMMKIQQAVQQMLAKTNVTFHSCETNWGNVEELLVPVYFSKMPQCICAYGGKPCYKVSNTNVECPNPSLSVERYGNKKLYHKL